MKKYLGCLLVLAICPALSYGGVNLTLLDGEGSASVTVDPASLDPQAFDVVVGWDSDESIDALQMQLKVSGPSGDADSLWNVTTRTVELPTIGGGNPVDSNRVLFGTYYNPIAENSTIYPGNIGTKNAGGMESWFESVEGALVPAQTGKTLITYTLDAADLSTIPAGDYTLTLGGTGILVFKASLGGSPVPVTSSSMTITVLPEPASALLLLLAAPFIRRRTA